MRSFEGPDSGNKYLYPVLGLLMGGGVVLFYTGTDLIGFLNSGYASRDFTMLERLLTQLRVVCHYISLIFFPVPSRLNLEHDFNISSTLFDPVTTFMSLVILLVFLCLPLYYGKSKELSFFVVLWFFVNILTESSLLGLEIIFEHRIYLPSAMIFLLISFETYEYIRNKNFAFVLLSIAVVAFSLLSFTRNAAWADPGYFWRDTYNKSPKHYRVCYNYGAYLSEIGNFDAAIEMTKKTLLYKPDYLEAYVNIGSFYGMKGNHLEAVRWFEKLVQMNSYAPDLYLNLSTAYWNLGMVGKSNLAYQKHLLYTR